MPRTCAPASRRSSAGSSTAPSRRRRGGAPARRRSSAARRDRVAPAQAALRHLAQRRRALSGHLSVGVPCVRPVLRPASGVHPQSSCATAMRRAAADLLKALAHRRRRAAAPALLRLARHRLAAASTSSTRAAQRVAETAKLAVRLLLWSLLLPAPAIVRAGFFCCFIISRQGVGDIARVLENVSQLLDDRFSACSSALRAIARPAAAGATTACRGHVAPAVAARQQPQQLELAEASSTSPGWRPPRASLSGCVAAAAHPLERRSQPRRPAARSWPGAGATLGSLARTARGGWRAAARARPAGRARGSRRPSAARWCRAPAAR